jgi:hypothetical protein
MGGGGFGVIFLLKKEIEVLSFVLPIDSAAQRAIHASRQRISLCDERDKLRSRDRREISRQDLTYDSIVP